ncbi:MAG: ATP-binding cassette domain-containing protein [Flammeovirgaceae bacterium]
MRHLYAWLGSTWLVAGQSPRALASLVGATLLQASLDLASTSALIPLVLTLLAPQALSNVLWMAAVQDQLSVSPTELKWVILATVLFFFLLKYVVVKEVIQHRVATAYAMAGKLSETLMQAFLQQSYSVYYQQKSAGQLVNIIHLPNTFAHNVFLPTLSIAAEVIVLVLLSVVFAILDPILFLGVFVTGVPLFFWYTVGRKKLDHISYAQKSKYPELIGRVLAMFDGFLEINIYQQQKPFVDEFKKNNRDLNQAQVELHTLQSQSGRLLETIFAVALCLVVGLAMTTNKTESQMVMVITVYTIGGLRLIPSVNRIMSGILQIKTNSFAQTELAENLSHLKERQTRADVAFNFEKPLEVAELTFQYPNRNILIRNANLVLNPGDKVAFIGTSGTGKSSLLLLLLGFLKPNEGIISIGNVNSQDRSWQTLFAFVPQTPILFLGSIASNICLSEKPENASLKKIEEVLEQVGLLSWVTGLPQGVHTAIGAGGIQISGGQRQRLAIARALFMKRSIIVMDEPTAQLDNKTAEDLIRLITQLPATIIIATHQLNILAPFHRVYELKGSTLSAIEQPVV